MRKFAAPLLALTLILSTIWTAAGAETPPSELVQYVRNAMRVGVKEPMIEQNAVARGWSASLVESTIAYVKSQPKSGEVLAADSQPGASNAVVPTPPGVVKPAAPSKGPDAGTDPAVAARDRGVPDDYQIGAGDVLHVSVWKEPDASVPTVVVRPDGKISLPLLKEVEVMGLTPRQAEGVITEGLLKMIKSADVTVIVTAINSKKVYIVGAAKKEGPLPFTYRMTVMQAISEAGGLTDYAKRKKIYVLHTDNGKEYRLPFNYDEVIRGEKTEQNIQLSPGDTLFIPH